MGRLVIVSNRVGGSIMPSEGGLVTAVQAALGLRDAVWFGWSGTVSDEPPGATRIEHDGAITRMVVDLQRADYEGYYVAFANRMLWPLFHYRIDLAEYDRDAWSTYCRVNEFFAARLAEMLAPDDLVWIHDYHLMQVGASLRRLGVGNRIGFFLHIPFPPAGVLATLPVHETLVRALFAYDLVGFQTETDLQCFGDYVEREAGGWMVAGGTAHAFGASLDVGVYPIGVDTRMVAIQAARASRTGQAARLRESLSGRRLVIGVDRLDYSKGLIRRLASVERLLERQAHYRRAIVMLQIASPTREEIPEYQNIRAQLDACMGRINGRFGEPDLLPVRYLNRRFRQESLFGFYRASRVALVTPLRDGMNLVAKEFVASQDADDPGSLVLSRFAGAARELSGALIVNPYDIDEVSVALDRALAMSLEERRERHGTMLKRLSDYDIHAWFRAFIEGLQRPRSAAASVRPAAGAVELRH